MRSSLRQDVQMIEEEQQAYLNHPEHQSYELNRALVSVQRLIENQAAEQAETRHE